MHAGDLEVVPGFGEERLDVALELGEDLGVLFGAIAADESSERHIAKAAPVLLAVDAEGIELLFVDALLQVVVDLVADPITQQEYLLSLVFCFCGGRRRLRLG